PIVVPPELDLRTWVEEYFYRHHHKGYPVVSGEAPVGLITTRDLATVPREEWAQRRVSDVMRRDLGPISVHPDSDALKALERMQRTGSSRLLVVENGKLVGLLSLKDLLRFLDLKLELEHEQIEERASAPKRTAEPEEAGV